MAYQDALFQLGMDLTRSSTAQKEDHGETARVAHNCEPGPGTPSARLDCFIERDSVKFGGNHLVIDLMGAKKLGDLKHIEQTLKRCVEVAGATLQHVHLHPSTPSTGVSGVAVLSGGHLSIHTWPERDFAAMDVFMSGHDNAYACVGLLQEAFGAAKVTVTASQRGEIERGIAPVDIVAQAAKVGSGRSRQRTKVRRAA